MGKNNSLDRIRRLLLITTVITTVPGTVTTALGIILIMNAQSAWEYVIAGAISVASSACILALWRVQSDIFINLDEPYRDKRMWATHILTPVFAVIMSALASFFYIFNDMAVRLHLEHGIAVAEAAQRDVNKAQQKILQFIGVIEGKTEEIAALAESERSGLLSGVGGEGEVFRRLKQGERQISAIHEVMEQGKLEIEALVVRSGGHIQRMRRAIPPKGDPLEGLEDYTKAQRLFYNDFQALSQKNWTLQVKTMLDGFESSLVNAKNKEQRKNLATVNMKMQSIAQSIISAMEDQVVKTPTPPQWSMGSPVYLSFLYFKHGFLSALLVVCIETCPLFLIWALWACRRQSDDEGGGDPSYRVRDLETLAKAIKGVTDAGKQDSKQEDKDHD